MPTLRQFEHVVALADCRSFVRAAKLVGLTQPAFSLSIAKIEDEYGAALFTRSKKDVAPTAQGEIVIGAARRSLMIVTDLQREMDLSINAGAARFIIGCDALMGQELLAPTLNEIVRSHRDVRFSVQTGAWDRLIDDLENGKIDIYIGSFVNEFDNRFIHHVLEVPRQIMFCRPDHPIMKLATIGVKDIMLYPMVGPRAAPWVKNWLHASFETDPIPKFYKMYEDFIECDDYGITRHIVRNSNALGYASASVIEQDVRLGDVRTFLLDDLSFSMPAAIAASSSKLQHAAVAGLVTDIAAAFAPSG